MDWIGIESGMEKEEIGEDVGGRNASNNYSPRITKTHFHFIKLKRKKGEGDSRGNQFSRRRTF